MAGRPKGTAESTTAITFRLSPELRDRIKRAAAAEERKITTFIVRALRVAVEESEAATAPAPKKRGAAR